MVALRFIFNILIFGLLQLINEWRRFVSFEFFIRSSGSHLFVRLFYRLVALRLTRSIHVRILHANYLTESAGRKEFGPELLAIVVRQCRPRSTPPHGHHVDEVTTPLIFLGQSDFRIVDEFVQLLRAFLEGQVGDGLAIGETLLSELVVGTRRKPPVLPAIARREPLVVPREPAHKP